MLRITAVMLWSLFLLMRTDAQQRQVTFEFAPSSSLTTIGFPDDWQKTLVTETGALAYDFGPGPYARPLTEITIGVESDTLRVVRQLLEDPLAPIVSTDLKGREASVHLESFAVLTHLGASPLPSRLTDRVSRVGGWNGAYGWATPRGTADPAFRNVAWGNNRAILYRVSVPKGSRKIVALGLCEPYKPRPGTRLLELRVEGADPLTVDPLRDSVQNKPLVLLFEAADVNRDGELQIEVHPTAKSPDPNVFLNVFWVFPEGIVVNPDDVLRGSLSGRAEVYFDCGRDLELASSSPRVDGMMATIISPDTRPYISVRTRRELAFDEKSGRILSGDLPMIVTNPRLVSAEKTLSGWKFFLPKGTKHVEAVVVHGAGNRESFTRVPDLVVARRGALHFWRTTSSIPRSTITVADPAIQYLVDASVRNMYQVREWVDGALQYQPGPTVYRGLWLGDILLTGTAVLAAGDTASLRQYLEAAFRYQLPNGHVRVMVPTLSLTETPIVVAGMCFYARSAGNKEWLRTHWDIVRKGVRWIEETRNQTLADSSSPMFGLMPKGFVDGGIAEPMADYGSVWWAMVALEQASQAAIWLGRNEEATAWTRLWKEFSASLEKAAQRDLQYDTEGRLFLPVGIGERNPKKPQVGQYSLLFPFKYGKFFHHPTGILETVIKSNLDLLDANTKQGLIVSSGWLNNGVWPWLGGVHGITHLLRGNKEKAIDLLYAYANHASPAGTWVEEQLIKEVGNGTTGDVSNAEASAVFVHFVRNLLAQERGNDLELLAGLPETWMKPGATNALQGSFTEFGPVSLALTISDDGSTATFRCSAVDGRESPGRPVVLFGTMKNLGFTFEGGKELPDRWEGSWMKPMEFRLARTR